MNPTRPSSVGDVSEYDVARYIPVSGSIEVSGLALWSDNLHSLVGVGLSSCSI